MDSNTSTEMDLFKVVLVDFNNKVHDFYYNVYYCGYNELRQYLVILCYGVLDGGATIGGLKIPFYITMKDFEKGQQLTEEELEELKKEHEELKAKHLVSLPDPYIPF